MNDEFYKLAIIGYPIGHSLSPVLYDAAFKDLLLRGSYEKLLTPEEDLVNQIKYLRKNRYYGFNVTIPHKVPVTLFLAKYDDFVKMTGAVNTVKIEKDQSLSGYNTDVWGFMRAIPKDINLKGKKAAVLGTGGAARAVCAGLYTLGVSSIDIYTRNVVNSANTLTNLRVSFENIKFEAIQTSLMNDLSDIDILVNTTPVGMKNFDEESCPVSDKCFESMSDNILIYDIVYNPLRTALISKAIKYNKRFIAGLDMLIWQAVRAMEIWTGRRPDFQAMKIAALETMIINGY